MTKVTNRLLVVLVSITLVLQAVILYRQWKHSAQPSPQQDPILVANENTFLDIAGAPIRGNGKVGVVLVEFSDFECPFCQRHATTVAPQIEKEYIVPGKISHVLINLPLQMHQSARMMAAAAICAGEQDRYWEMYSALFNATPKTKDEITLLQRGLGLNPIQFHQCLDSDQNTAALIDRDMRRAQDLQLSSTPAFAVGRFDSQGRVNVRRFIRGAQPLSVFKNELDNMLLE